MRRFGLAIVPLLWFAPAPAQDAVPPAPAADEAPAEAARPDATDADGQAPADETADKPGRVIKIEIIGEKKPATFTAREEHPALRAQRQSELDRQRQRLLEARRRREQQDRARRVGNAARQAAPLRRQSDNP